MFLQRVIMGRICKIEGCRAETTTLIKGLCKRCYAKQYRQAHLDFLQDREQRRGLRTRYGLSVEKYGQILAMQRGVCAICSRPPKTRRLSVDHDHETGKVRGLLCYPCNSRLLQRRHTPLLLRRAARYLERNS